MTGFPEWLKERLKYDLPGQSAQMKMMPVHSKGRFPIPTEGKQSSVLLLFYPTGNRDYTLLAIKRVADGGVHSGQIAFPGGKYETTDLNFEATALREACEEINLNPGHVEVLGKLSPLYIPASNFIVHPFVGFCSSKPLEVMASKDEVDEIIEISLSRNLSQKSIEKIPLRSRPGITLKAPVYLLGTLPYLWGASAMILSEFEALWNEFRKEIKEF